MYCSKCGSEFLEGAKFCQKCGAPAPFPTPPEAGTSQVFSDFQPETVPPIDTQPADTLPVPPVKQPGFASPGFPQKKKVARWPWVVCGIGFVAVILIIAVIVGGTISQTFGSSETQTETVALTETYSNEEEGFSFQYPSAWEPMSQEQMEAYKDPDDPGETVALLANETEDLPEATSYIMVSKFSSTQESVDHLYIDDDEFVETFDPDVTILETSIINLGGVDTRQISYIDREIYYQSYIYPVGLTLYRVDFSCTESQSSVTKRFFDAVIDSYTITEFPKEKNALNPDMYIQMVIEGYQIDRPDLTYGEAFDTFFSSPKWECFESEDGEIIVEFTGDCTYLDAPVTACIQFVIHEEENTFDATWLNFNGVPQSDIVLTALIEKVFAEAGGSGSDSNDTSLIDWTTAEHHFKLENDLYAGITFYPDGTFSMVVNMFEGIGAVHGTYIVAIDGLECTVDNQMMGNSSDVEIEEFKMIFQGECLQFSGERIGTSFDGMTYYPSES